MAISIWEIEQTLLNSRKGTAGLKYILSGEYHNELRAELAKNGITAKEYAISELCKCDIYVDGDKIAYQVREIFPEVSHNQVLIWLCENAEEHHEIFGTAQ